MKDLIKILIIEDEIPARKKLKRFLAELGTPIEIMAEISTVSEGISFLKNNSPDLIFSDIELLDGNSFEIYNQVPLTCPIIFTTAYDQFWMNAFESNGIDYLLKPYPKERLQKAWSKVLLFRNSTTEKNNLLATLTNLIEQNFAVKSQKKRFTVHTKQGIYFLGLEEISFFEACEGVVFAADTNGKKHLLTYTTLKEIENQLDASDYLRINRSELISKIHVEKIERYTKNTLAIKMKGHQTYLKTSQSNTSALREWIEK